MEFNIQDFVLGFSLCDLAVRGRRKHSLYSPAIARRFVSQSFAHFFSYIPLSKLHPLWDLRRRRTRMTAQ